MLFFTSIIHARDCILFSKRKKSELNKGFFFPKELWHLKNSGLLLMPCKQLGGGQGWTRKMLWGDGNYTCVGYFHICLPDLSHREGIMVEIKQETGNKTIYNTWKWARKLACMRCRKSAFVPNASDESVKNIHLWRRISSNSVKVAVCMGYVPSNCPVAT